MFIFFFIFGKLLECQHNVYKFPGRISFRIPWTLSGIKVMSCCLSALWATKTIWSLPPVCPQRFWPVTLKLTFPGNYQLAGLGIMNQMSLHVIKFYHSNFSGVKIVFWKVYLQGYPPKGTWEHCWLWQLSGPSDLCQEPHQLWGHSCVKCVDSGARQLGSKYWLVHMLVTWLVVCPLISKVRILCDYFTGLLWG